MAAAKINYQIKLMSGNNVVLIEAAGYDSEIFMPQIDSHGRISFVNIIASRRCCPLSLSASAANCSGKSTKFYIKKETGETTTTPLIPPLNALRRTMNSGNNKENFRRPLANSTPTPAIVVGKSSSTITRIKDGSTNCTTKANTNTFGSGESTLPTPEPFRRAIPAPRQLVDNTLFNLPKGIKVMRLYHNSRDGTPSKVGRLVSTTSSSAANMNSITREDFHNMSNMSCSFRIPATPPHMVGNGAQMGMGVVSSTPLSKSTKLPTTAEGSNSKWRKCKTPIRTYSKRGGGVTTKRNPSLSSLKKGAKPVHIVPTYLVNPTQGTKPTHRIELRRRKLVVDGKVRISSRAFKRAFKENQDNNTKSILDSAVSFTSLQKRRKQPMSAFDLLTNSNRFRCLSARLNEQFRQGCVNKASSTNSKYKVLCTVPPLQEDEQVLELTQSQLQLPSFVPSAGQISKDKANGGGNVKTQLKVSSKITTAIKSAMVVKAQPHQRVYSINPQIERSKPTRNVDTVHYIIK